jgi:hypothetical protein
VRETGVAFSRQAHPCIPTRLCESGQLNGARALEPIQSELQPTPPPGLAMCAQCRTTCKIGCRKLVLLIVPGQHPCCCLNQLRVPATKKTRRVISLRCRARDKNMLPQLPSKSRIPTCHRGFLFARHWSVRTARHSAQKAPPYEFLAGAPGRLARFPGSEVRSRFLSRTYSRSQLTCQSTTHSKF